MKILFVYTNRYRYLSPPPVGLSYLIFPLIDQGHKVKILDLMFSKNPHKEIADSIKEFNPELVGFSIRNLDNQYMIDLKNPLPEIKEFVSIAKNKNKLTVLGGTAFTTMPVEMLDFMNADYGITGQGEESLPKLARAIEDKKNTSDIPGLVYKNTEGKIIINPPSTFGYDSKKRADWKSINLKLYKKNAILTPAASVVVKIGCPYGCNFCDTKVSMGNKFIFCDIDSIIDDIKSIKKFHNINWFFLNGTCFNSPLDSVKKILYRIIKENLKIRFMSRLYPIRSCYDSEFFDLYRKADRYFTMMDLSSFSDRMLASYKKPFNIQDIYDFGRLANKHGLKFGVELLFGGPGESNETIKESMDFLPKLKYSILFYSIGIRISPHTEIFGIAKKEGLVKDTKELLFSKFYISKDMDTDWAKKYIDKSLTKYFFRYMKMPPMILRNFIERF